MTENKRFNVFDVGGTIFLEDHKEGSYHIGEIGNVDVNCLNDIADRLNELAEENEQLKSDNQELKQDNDIKFWKREYIKEANANSVLLFELGKAINGGYEVSDKFKDFMNDLNKSIENEKKKLERLGLND